MPSSQPVVVIAGLAAGLWAASVTLVSAAPISGTYSGSSTLTPTATPGVFTQNFVGGGSDAAFGSFTLTDQSILDLSSPPTASIRNVTFAISFAGGTIFGTGFGSGTDIAPGVVSAALDLVVTGETGEFTGDGGYADASELDTDSGPGTLSVTDGFYEGSLIAVPEPAVWTLVPAAFLATASMRRRAKRD